ncbi:PREDICTED: transmembrane protein 53-like [Populus euphratica]|uniref:Transmembrane protein 53-like n=1 Tax=Populus euphratica TaxID=75702 RepID=A0AAJ6XKH0_POPEU|nr:PREDICTED: transmembrane protein 53-like [Populus euphratica]XP_011022004.1 PREDICTED: transmembrane protein 53-like [Populus euphratica]
MSSLSGMLQRPVIAAAAAALASVSVDFSDKLQSFRSFDSCSTSEQSSSSLSNSVHDSNFSWVSHSSVSKLASLSFVTRIQIPVPKLNFAVLDVSQNFVPSSLGFSVASSPLLVSLYQSAELAKGPKQSAFKTTNIPSSTPDILYRWNLPEPSTIDVSGSSDCLSEKSRTVVVLLGWLGSKQKHLKKYAEWYTSRGFHVITFTFPMADILCYQVGGKAEQDIDLLVNHLTDWLEEDRKNLVFHTFSNTGWLTYGVILEKFQKQDPSLMGRIRGCIVDSAPVAAPDPQVWASGFSAAFLKNHSIATRVHMSSKESDMEVLVGSKTLVEPKPAITESALLAILEKFFDVILNLPTVNRRLSGVLSLLSSGQPSCPQLYIYSSADRVIPAGSVESFIEEQRRAGHEVRACNFVFTPHVDHFRNDPKLYTTQLSQFLDDYVLTRCKCS